MSIESLRDRFNKDVEANPSLYHPIDIERVRTEEWQVKRYLQQFDNDEDKAFDLLTKSMRWKKEFGVHERTDQYFPLEFYELSGNEILGRDKQGRLIQLEVFRNQHNFSELTLLQRQFVVHSLERIDRQAGENGFILLMDTNGAGVSNVNLDLTKFKLTVNEYYPGSLQQMFVIDLPWLLSPIMKVIIGFMHPQLREKLVYVKRQQLVDYIDPEYIPKSLNGNKEKSQIPENLERFEICYKRFDLNENFIDQYYKFHKLTRTK